jgi:D-alanyl-D-alanine carboxypeptidase
MRRCLAAWLVLAAAAPALAAQSLARRLDLVLYGRGDPTMSRRCFDEDTTRTGACESDPSRRLWELAAVLRQKGIGTVAGSVEGDGSYFEPETVTVAGRSGTIRPRMAGTAVEGRGKAKTGSIFRVNALSGSVTLPNGRTGVFSIQTNNHDLGAAAMLARIDSLVVEVGM